MPPDHRNLFDVPNLLLQKFPAPKFTATTKLTFTARADGEKIGLAVMALDYSYLAVTKKSDGLYAAQAVCKNAEAGTAETVGPELPVRSNTIYLRVVVEEGAICRFAMSSDGIAFTPVGDPFTASKGKWIGAKVGIFAVRDGKTYESGYADFDWFRIE